MDKPKAKSTSAANGNGRARRAREFSHRSAHNSPPCDLESAIVKIATSGKLAQAAQAAIRAQRRAGLPVTYMRDNKIVREFPDGRREVIRTLPKAEFEVPKGVAKIRKG